MNNLVFLSGIVKTDPEVDRTPAGRRILKFRLLTLNGRDPVTGASRRGDLHQVVFWEPIHSKDTRVDRYFQEIKRNEQVIVLGRIRYAKWTSRKDGQEKQRTEIIARQIDFGGRVEVESNSDGTDSGESEVAEGEQDSLVST